MNANLSIDLKSIFSWPAYLSHIFYIIKNKNKIWEKESRENSSPEILYSWTFDFIKILKLSKEYDNETKKIILTNEWEELYEIIKNIDNSLLYEYWEVSESNIDIYEQNLIQNISKENVDKLKKILLNQLLKTKWYSIIKEILNEKEIPKSELYEKIADKIWVAKWTLWNRVPSILQMAKFLNLFSLENWKYSISKNLINTEYKIPNNNSNMEKLTSQESLLLISLLTKPFSILYWVSWTWKSRVVKELWKKLYWDNYKKYFHKESVPPNWFDETEILWRYNEIEKYKEWSFIKKLEEAIKDPGNNYVYLLDEMNLSHIEQYFAQYLSSVEDLNNSWWWINVWECSIYHTKKNRYYSETINFNLNDTEVIKDLVVLNTDHKFKPSFLLATFTVDWEKVIESTRNVWDFYYQFITYIIDNYNESLNLFKRFDELEDYENIRVTKNNWFKFEDKKYILYNWYYFENNIKLLDRLNYISSVVDKVNSNFRENIYFSFWAKNNDIPELYYFYDNEDNIIWKSLRIPKNLFVVWTINLDETTKSISPKVVDRANIIEFNDLDNFLFIEDNNKYDLDFLNNLDTNKFNFNEFIELRNIISNTNSERDLELVVELDKKTKKLLNRFYQFLKVFKLHFSYRTLKEVIIFIAIWKKLWLNEDQLFDLAIMQKILPKLNWIIDYSFKLYTLKDQKLLSYDLSWSDNQLLTWFDGIDNWVISWENVYKNTSLKLRRMQHFFDTYQNVNYFLS